MCNFRTLCGKHQTDSGLHLSIYLFIYLDNVCAFNFLLILKFCKIDTNPIAL